MSFFANYLKLAIHQAYEAQRISSEISKQGKEYLTKRIFQKREIFFLSSIYGAIRMNML